MCGKFLENESPLKMMKNVNAMTSEPEKQIFAIYVLLNISRNTSNQTMKFAELME